MTTFDNHAPINFGTAEDIAEFEADLDFGHHRVYIQKGKKYHIWESSNSGWSHNGRDPRTHRTYLGGFETIAALQQWLLGVDEDVLCRDAVNTLLLETDYEGEEA